MKILVSTWGNPWRDRKGRVPSWGEAQYEIGDTKTKARTTLIPLLDAVRPDRVILIALDTLAQAPIPSNRYDCVVEDARNSVEEFLDLEGIGDRVDEIVISPGVGRFPGRDFRGELRDFYSWTLHALTEILTSAADVSGIHVHLDLSHGINFMPVLTYRAVVEILSAAAAASDVRLTVYNADPYPRSPEGAPSLRINVVESGEIAWRPPRKGVRVGPRVLEPLESLGPSMREALYRDQLRVCRELNSRELNAFLGSLANGLPLATYTFYPDGGALSNCVRRALEIYLEKTEVQSYGDLLRVRRAVSLGQDFDTLVEILLLTRVLGLERRGVVSLQDLQDLQKRVFSRNKKLEAAIGYDLAVIRRIVEAEPRRFLEWAPPVGGDEPVGWSERNFLAHSGLEYNVVEVKADRPGRPTTEGVLLRYSPDPQKVRLVLAASSRGIAVPT